MLGPPICSPSVPQKSGGREETRGIQIPFDFHIDIWVLNPDVLRKLGSQVLGRKRKIYFLCLGAGFSLYS